MKILTTAQAGKILGVAQNTITSYIARGDVRAEKIKGMWVVDRDSVMAFKAKQKANPPQVKPSVARKRFESRIGTPSKAEQERNDRLHREKLAAFIASGREPIRL